MNKVAKNAVWIIGVKIVQSLLSFVVGMLTARYLGPSNYGLINYAASLTAFVLPIAQLGIGNILVREVVDKPEQEGRLFGTAIVLNFFSAIACVIGVAAFSVIVNPDEPITILVCVLYSLNLLMQALDLVNYWYQAKLLSKYSSIIGLCAYVFVSIYKIILLVAQKSVYWFALTASIDSLIIGILSILLYRKLGGKHFRFSWETGKSLFAKSKYYIVSSMMIAVFAQTDKIMLKLMMNETMTGYYSAALTCAGIISFVFPAIIDSFRPSIFEAFNISHILFERRMAMLYSIIIFLSLAQSVIIALFAPLIVHIIYGQAYDPAATALRIVVWNSTFSFLGSVRNIWILANNQQRHLWKINLTGALANVLLNAVLIPSMGINGAALASLVTQFFTNVLTGYIIAPIRENNRIMLIGCNPKYLLAAIKTLKLKR